jgi:hypothetical protein
MKHLQTAECHFFSGNAWRQAFSEHAKSITVRNFMKKRRKENSTYQIHHGIVDDLVAVGTRYKQGLLDVFNKLRLLVLQSTLGAGILRLPKKKKKTLVSIIHVLETNIGGGTYTVCNMMIFQCSGKWLKFWRYQLGQLEWEKI